MVASGCTSSQLSDPTSFRCFMISHKRVVPAQCRAHPLRSVTSPPSVAGASDGPPNAGSRQFPEGLAVKGSACSVAASPPHPMPLKPRTSAVMEAPYSPAPAGSHRFCDGRTSQKRRSSSRGRVRIGAGNGAHAAPVTSQSRTGSGRPALGQPPHVCPALKTVNLDVPLGRKHFRSTDAPVNERERSKNAKLTGLVRTHRAVQFEASNTAMHTAPPPPAPPPTRPEYVTQDNAFPRPPVEVPMLLTGAGTGPACITHYSHTRLRRRPQMCLTRSSSGAETGVTCGSHCAHRGLRRGCHASQCLHTS